MNIGRSISTREIRTDNMNSINIDDMINKLSDYGKSNFDLSKFTTDKRKVRGSTNKPSYTYDEIIEMENRDRLTLDDSAIRRNVKSKSKGILIPSDDDIDDDIDDPYADEFICDCCSNIRNNKYDSHICDTCNECENCAEYCTECSGCSYSIHRDGSYYWIRHPEIIPPDTDTDKSIMDFISSDGGNLKFKDDYNR